MKIFVDDERIPVDSSWSVVRSYDEFTRLVWKAGDVITAISFDHDLGLASPSGVECVHWLVDLAIDHPEMVVNIQKIMFHTANIVGMENMSRYIANAQKYGILENVELINHSCLFHTDHAIMPPDFDESSRKEGNE